VRDLRTGKGLRKRLPLRCEINEIARLSHIIARSPRWKAPQLHQHNNWHIKARPARGLRRLHTPDKARHAAIQTCNAGSAKPETFKLLGAVFICGRSCQGKFLLKWTSRPDGRRAKLAANREELRQRMHQPIP
jgi:hypothetical protein